MVRIWARADATHAPVRERLTALADEAFKPESVTVGLPRAGWLEVFGWSRGHGARATLTRWSTDGQAVEGAAALQVHPSGDEELFVAFADAPSDDAAIVAWRAIDAVSWGYCDPTASFPDNCPAQPAPIPSSRPIAPPEPLPTLPPVTLPQEPRGPSHRAQVDALLRRLDEYPRCERYWGRGIYDPREWGATVAVRCDRPGDLAQIAVYQFPDEASMYEYWEYRIGEIEVPMPRRVDACWSGRQGVSTWRGGRVACWYSEVNKRAQLRWTEDRTNTFWIADATYKNVGRLAEWWRTRLP